MGALCFSVVVANTHTRTYIHSHTHKRTRTHTRTHARARAHTRMRTHTHTRTRTHTHSHTHMHTRAHTHTHTHARTHVRTHTHNQTPSSKNAETADVVAYIWVWFSLTTPLSTPSVGGGGDQDPRVNPAHRRRHSRPPSPQTRGTQSHSAPTPLKRPMLTPERGLRPRVSA